jgi:hypothetical protein
VTTGRTGVAIFWLIGACALSACSSVAKGTSQPATLIPDQTTATTLTVATSGMPLPPDMLPTTADSIADPALITPDQALMAQDWGGVGSPNATAGSYVNTNTILINRSRFDVEVVGIELGAPLEGTMAGYQVYWYTYRGDGGNYELVWGEPLSGPLPGYVNRFDGTPILVRPVADTSWPYPHTDPHAIWIVSVIDYNGKDKLVLGPFTVTYRIRGTTTTYTTGISQGGLVLCPPGYTDPCVP